MFTGNGVFFWFLLLISHIAGLVELPKVDDNNILATEAIIRSTVNTLFTALKLKDLKNKPKLKEYSTVHNQFIDFTLQDYNNLKQIAQLTRVVKNESNVDIINFMSTLNELLNEDSTENKELTLNSKEEIVVDYIEDFLHKLELLKEEYGFKHDDVRLKEDIYQIFKEEDLFLFNFTSQEVNSNSTNDKETLLDDDAFWKPDKILDGRRIFRGDRTKIKYFPFMASIQIFNSFQCGGSIIKSDLIITAASCLQLAYNNRLFRENPAFLSVRVGSDFYNGGSHVPVLEVYFHPEYNPKNLRNNICVLRLVRKLRFKKRQRRVKKINFDRSATVLPEVTDGITIVGWGAQGMNNVVMNPWRNALTYAVLDIYPTKDCQEIYSKEYVTPKHFCGGFFSRGGGACNRDVGGPGIVSGILTGIVSFGSPVCGSPDTPTVFTKVGFYSDWIETIMEQDVPDGYQKTTTKRENLLTIEGFFEQHVMARTTYHVKPLPNHAQPMAVQNVDALRMLRNTDLFREFLDTMFDSKEREQYQDILEMQEQQTLITRSMSKTSTPQPKYKKQEVSDIKHETPKEKLDYEPQTQESEESISTTPSFVSELDAPAFINKIENVRKPVKEDSKDLKVGLIDLLNNLDVDKLIENIQNLDNDKLDMDPKVLKMFEGKFGINKTADLDESILTMLYLSDIEKKRLNSLKEKESRKDTNKKSHALEVGKVKPFVDLTYRNNDSTIRYDFTPEHDLYNIMSNNMQKK